MIHNLSKSSLYIEMFLNEDVEKAAGIGTAFIIQLNNSKFYLVTNWHCVTGINPETNKPMSKSGVIHPEVMKVYFHKKDHPNEWLIKNIRLHDGLGKKFYLEHPLGKEVDVVIIPIPIYDDIDIFKVNDSLSAQNHNVEVTDLCSIVGFPKGLSSGGKYPIWKSGHLASDYSLNWNGKKIFLVDATTREGMSGSPVFFVNNGVVKSSNGNLYTSDKQFIVLLGIYSGRIEDDIEIGRVWKIDYINDFAEIIRNQEIKRQCPVFSNNTITYKLIN